MSSRIGKIIKMKRIEKSMTQEELCVGICTPSYLSRIENNRVVADESIYTLLFERLGIDVPTNENPIDVDGELELVYKKLLVNEVVTEADMKTLESLAVHAGADAMMKYELVYCKYLLRGKKLDEVHKRLSSIDIVIQNKLDRTYFIYCNIYLLYYYYHREYEKAIAVSNQLIQTSGYRELGDAYELGIFFYNLALNYKNIYEYHESIHYATEGLQIFNENYFLECALDCQILLGICYNNIQKSDQSIRAYHHAKRILSYLPGDKHSQYVGIIHNNLGNCFENQEDYHQAVAYYLKSLEYDRKENSKMMTYLNLVRCYYKLGQWTEAIDWLERAYKHISKQTDKLYVYQIRIFQRVLGHVPKMEEIVSLQEETIAYFMEQKRWSLVSYYGELFAQMYEKANHHKKANLMYKEIMKAQENIRFGG